jgi:membrane protease YdiL (CAAX protease family)
MRYDELSASEQQGMSASTVAGDARTGIIAPWWHTALLLAQLSALALIGPRSARRGAALPHVVLYTGAIMSTWMQLGAAVAGIYRRREFFFDTLQRRAGSVLKDALLGCGLCFATVCVFGLVTATMHRVGVYPGFDRSVLVAMAPVNWIELVMWLAVSISVGFCEEHVFRGYLLQQGIGWAAKAGASPRLGAIAAVVFTSVLFGSLHMYEGFGGAVLITLLGAMYAVVALRLGNLRVVITAHVLQDFLAFVAIMMRHHYGAR